MGAMCSSKADTSMPGISSNMINCNFLVVSKLIAENDPMTASQDKSVKLSDQKYEHLVSKYHLCVKIS